MIAYEFSGTLTKDGCVVIPRDYVQEIPAGSSVRVILLVEEPVAVPPNGYASPDETLLALEELVARIQSRPSDPANIIPASGSLAERLANPVTEPDPAFDVETWIQQWDALEAEMKVLERAHEQARLKDLMW